MPDYSALAKQFGAGAPDYAAMAEQYKQIPEPTGSILDPNPDGNQLVENAKSLGRGAKWAAQKAWENPIETGAIVAGMAAAPFTGGASIPAAAAIVGGAGALGAGAGIGVKAVRGDPDTPKTFKDIAMRMGEEGLTQAAGEGAGRVVEAGLMKAGKRIYQSVLKPTKAMIAENPRLMDTAIEHYVPVSRSGRAGKLSGESMEAADALVHGVDAGANPPVIRPYKAMRGGVKRANSQVDELPIHRGYLRANRKNGIQYLREHPDDLSLTEAQAAVRQTDRFFNPGYRASLDRGDVVKDSYARTSMGINDETRQMLRDRVPGLQAQNRQTGDLAGLQEAIDKRLVPQDNRSMVGMQHLIALGAGTGAGAYTGDFKGAGLGTALGVEALTHPAVASHIALAAGNLSHLPFGTAFRTGQLMMRPDEPAPAAQAPAQATTAPQQAQAPAPPPVTPARPPVLPQQAAAPPVLPQPQAPPPILPQQQPSSSLPAMQAMLPPPETPAPPPAQPQAAGPITGQDKARYDAAVDAAIARARAAQSPPAAAAAPPVAAPQPPVPVVRPSAPRPRQALAPVAPAVEGDFPPMRDHTVDPPHTGERPRPGVPGAFLSKPGAAPGDPHGGFRLGDRVGNGPPAAPPTPPVAQPTPTAQSAASTSSWPQGLGMIPPGMGDKILDGAKAYGSRLIQPLTDTKGYMASRLPATMPVGVDEYIKQRESAPPMMDDLRALGNDPKRMGSSAADLTHDLLIGKLLGKAANTKISVERERPPVAAPQPPPPGAPPAAAEAPPVVKPPAPTPKAPVVEPEWKSLLDGVEAQAKATPPPPPAEKLKAPRVKRPSFEEQTGPELTRRLQEAGLVSREGATPDPPKPAPKKVKNRNAADSAEQLRIMKAMREGGQSKVDAMREEGALAQLQHDVDTGTGVAGNDPHITPKSQVVQPDGSSISGADFLKAASNKKTNELMATFKPGDRVTYAVGATPGQKIDTVTTRTGVISERVLDPTEVKNGRVAVTLDNGKEATPHVSKLRRAEAGAGEPAGKPTYPPRVRSDAEIAKLTAREEKRKGKPFKMGPR